MKQLYIRVILTLLDMAIKESVHKEVIFKMRAASREGIQQPRGRESSRR